MTKLTRLTLVITLSLFSLVAIFVRLYDLGNTPQGLTQDEAYYLYDGYSIHETGRDIWGNRLPLVFKSTGEYKLNLPYLISPAIDLVGLSTTAVRLPSALFGLLTLILVSLIIFEFTGSKLASIISALILALSPWHFGISRLFYEANVGIFPLMIGFYLAVKIVKGSTDQKYFLALTLSTALSAYFYGPYRYLGIGLVAITLLLAPVNNLRAKLKNSLSTILVYIIVLLPLLLQLDTSQSLTRLTQETKLHQFGYELTVNEARMNCYLKMDRSETRTKLCYAFWNKPLLFLEKAGRTATRLLSPEYLFFTSVDDYIVPSSYGAYLSYLLPLYLFGIYLLVQKLFSHRHHLLLALSLAGSLVIVSAIGEVVYHRFVFGLILVFIIIGLGLARLLHWLVNTHIRALALTITALILLLATFQHAKFITHYYTTHVVGNPLLFKYDAPEVYEFLADYQDYAIYDNIFYGPVYAGIYWGLDPADFQHNAVWADPDDWGFSNAQQWNNIHLTEKSLSNLLCEKHSNPDTLMHTLAVDNPGNYNEAALLLTHNFSHSLTLHAVYDIDSLYPFVLENYPADLCSLE